jgi:hypothetical protein
VEVLLDFFHDIEKAGRGLGNKHDAAACDAELGIYGGREARAGDRGFDVLGEADETNAEGTVPTNSEDLVSGGRESGAELEEGELLQATALEGGEFEEQVVRGGGDAIVSGDAGGAEVDVAEAAVALKGARGKVATSNRDGGDRLSGRMELLLAALLVGEAGDNATGLDGEAG